MSQGATSAEAVPLPRGRRADRSRQAAIATVAARLGTPYRTAVDLAYAVIREAILTGDLQPGERLNQDDLARGMGTSREPIRSAIRHLSADGLVTVVPHRGAVVRSLTEAQLGQIFILRRLIEPYAAYAGIKAMTPERLARLQALGAEHEAMAPSAAAGRVLHDFYRTLFDTANNPLIGDIIDRLRRDVAYWNMKEGIAKPDHGHRALLDCAVRGDAEGAARWLSAHLDELARADLGDDSAAVWPRSPYLASAPTE